MNRADRQRAARYRMALLSNDHFVLSDILTGACRFFGKIDADDIMSHTEMFVRQKVGREILSACGVFPGFGQEISPEKFVSQLSRNIEVGKRRNNG